MAVGAINWACCDPGCINQAFSGYCVQICMWEVPVLWVSIDKMEVWSEEWHVHGDGILIHGLRTLVLRSLRRMLSSNLCMRGIICRPLGTSWQKKSRPCMPGPDCIVSAHLPVVMGWTKWLMEDEDRSYINHTRAWYLVLVGEENEYMVNRAGVLPCAWLSA